MKRILLFIVGVGAGNTTRTLAWSNELKRLDPEIDLQIAAQGKAYELLSNHYPVHEMLTIDYGSAEEMSALSVIKNNLGFISRFRENQRRASKLIEDLEPDLIIADSDFYCLGPARKSGVFLATVNSSPVTMAQLKRDGVPADCGFSGHVIERADAWFQQRYSQAIICPAIQPMDSLAKKVFQIPPIVRKDFQKQVTIKEEVVAITGGSGIGASVIDLEDVSVPITVFGSEIQKVPEHAEKVEGFSEDLAETMCQAKVLVVQGGFSSVSEAIATRRPVVVVPIEGHAEQMMNAREIEELGIGKIATPANASQVIMEVWNEVEKFEAVIEEKKLPVNGAEKAAKIIRKLVYRKKN